MKPIKRPVGRPRKGDDVRVPLRCRVDAEALEAFRRHAKLGKMSVGDFLTRYGLSLV
jgi:uncharacterized protein (DUF4415 family)